MATGFMLSFSTTLFAQNHFPCRIESEKISDWKCLGPFNKPNEIANQHFGAVTAISVNPQNENEIYIGTDCSGLFYTSNKGISWSCLTDSFPYPIIGVNDIKVDYKKNERTIILATGKPNNWYDAIGVGLLISKDGGQTWKHTFPNPENIISSVPLFKILIDSSNNYWYVYGKNKIYRSKNEGAQWDEIFSKNLFPNLIYSDELYITSFELNQDGSSLFFATVPYPMPLEKKDGLLFEPDFFELTDCQKSNQFIQCVKHTDEIKKKYNPPSKFNSAIFKITKQHKNSDSLFVTRQYQGNRETSIYVFDMNLKKCISHTSPNGARFGEDLFWFEGLRVNPINPSKMYFTGFTLYSSSDSGKHFKSLYDYSFGDNHVPHADVKSLHITKYTEDGKGDHIFLGTDGGLSYSENSGRSFVNLNGEFLPITEFYGLGVSPFTGMISAGSQDNSIFTYDPHHKEWICNIRGDGYDIEYSKRKPSLAYGQYNGLVIHATSNDKAPFDDFIKAPSKGCNKKSLVTHKNGNLYFAGEQFNILDYKTNKWNTYVTNTPHMALAFAVSESDPNIIYLSSFWDRLYKSVDGGKTFSEITNDVKLGDTPLGSTRIHAICISPVNPNKLWISLGYLGDYLDICKQTPRVIHSSDGGITWVDYSKGLPIYGVTDLVFVDGTSATLFAATIEGVYIIENESGQWTLFSRNLPKCLITELQISYRSGTLLASTYGRGLWETKLPSLVFDAPRIIDNDTILSVENKDEALYFTTDIILKKKARLTIHCPVYLAQGKSIITRRKKQIKLNEAGMIIKQ